MDITKVLTKSPKAKPVFGKYALPFGKIMTDHMFLADYNQKDNWHNCRIVPYAPFEMEPATVVFHYGQTIFEGMKAYKSPAGEVLLFRPRENAKRFNVSASRMYMPQIDEELFLQGVKTLADIERDWIPDLPGMSLYVRPFMIATEATINLTYPETFMFSIITSPVGLISGGTTNSLNTMRILVEESYVRAAPGGTGFAKCGGNYAGAKKASFDAKAKGFDQVLWLDATERKYIEEVSTSNILFVIDGAVITPAVSDTILDGVTRKSILDILRGWNVRVEERKISIQELEEAHKAGKVSEVFSVGTAAVVSPIGEITHGDVKMVFNGNKAGIIAQRVYDELTGIQKGIRPDAHGWVVTV